MLFPRKKPIRKHHWKEIIILKKLTFFHIELHPSLDGPICRLAQLICKMTSPLKFIFSRIVDYIWARVVLFGTTEGGFIVITLCFALFKSNIRSITWCPRAYVRVCATITSFVGTYEPIPIPIYKAMIRECSWSRTYYVLYKQNIQSQTFFRQCPTSLWQYSTKFTTSENSTKILGEVWEDL